MRSTEPRSTNRPSIVTGSFRLRSSRPSSDRPKLNSKYAGTHDGVVGHLLHPDAEIAPQLVDFVAPDALDRRRQLLFVFGGHAIERGVDGSRGRRDAVARDRQRTGFLHRRGRTRPAPDETGCRASADRAARAAPARRAARDGRSSRAGTGTDTTRSAAAPTANTGGWRGVASRAPS